jgi:hypothetical protein
MHGMNIKRSYNSSITAVSTSNLTHFYLLLVSSSISARTALSNTNQAPPPPTLTSHPTLHYFSDYYESSEPYILHMQFQYETRVSALTVTSSLLHSSGTTRILCQLRSRFSTKGLHCLGPVTSGRVMYLRNADSVGCDFCPAKHIEQPLLLVHYKNPFSTVLAVVFFITSLCIQTTRTLNIPVCPLCPGDSSSLNCIRSLISNFPTASVLRLNGFPTVSH